MTAAPVVRARGWTAPGRVVGVDLARGAAVAGMVAVHVLPGTPGTAWAGLHDVAHGRASGLFGVLAGVSLGLVARSRPAAARERAATRTGVLVRGLLVALLGLALVGAGGNVAVVLPYYGLAFAVVLPFLWWPGRALAPLAAAWLVLGPLAGFWLRRTAGWAPRYEQPTLLALAQPLDLLRTLAVTGYYPVLGWAGYLLLGLAVSRADLRSARTSVALTGAGAVLASGAWLVSAVLVRRSPVPVTGTTLYGTVPTDSPWWLASAAPHAGTPLDLLHTSGTALAVLGLACLLPRAVTRWLVPVAAVGALPLSVYAGHVLALARWPGSTPALLATHVLLALLLATGWRLAFGRGPLERAVGLVAGGAAAAVRGPG